MRERPGVQIVIFTDCYRPRINGVVTSIVSLKGSLEKAGHQVTVIAPSYPEEDSQEPGVKRLKAFSFPTWPEDRASLPWPPGLLRALFRSKYDIVHVHTPFNLGVLGWWVARVTRRPMIFTHHTLWEEYHHYLPLIPPAWGRRIANSVCNYFFTRASHIVAPSDDVAEQLTLKGFGSRVRVIPTGIEPEIFEGGDPRLAFAELGLDPQRPLFLYIGRLAREKSIDYVFRAFAEALRQEPDIHLAVIGGGPEQVSLQKLSLEMGLGANVHFTGYKPRHHLKHYLAAARLFLFASETETQGLVLLEAAAAGLPVLAVRASGVKEAVNDGASGILCKSGDLDSFLKVILRFGRSDQERNKYAAAARAWAAEFSADASGQRMLNLYEEIRKTD